MVGILIISSQRIFALVAWLTKRKLSREILIQLSRKLIEGIEIGGKPVASLVWPKNGNVRNEAYRNGITINDDELLSSFPSHQPFFFPTHDSFQWNFIPNSFQTCHSLDYVGCLCFFLCTSHLSIKYHTDNQPCWLELKSKGKSVQTTFYTIIQSVEQNNILRTSACLLHLF